MTNREFFLQRWEQEHPMFLKVFRALPPDKSDFRPHPRSRTAAEIVWLLVQEEQACETLIDTLQVHWKESPPTLALQEMIAAYEKAHQEVAWRLKKLDDKTWEQNTKLLTESGVAYEDTLGGMFWAPRPAHHLHPPDGRQSSGHLRPLGRRPRPMSSVEQNLPA
jgi:hypothetical protein